MPGIRLQHPELRNTLYLVPVPWRELKAPFACPKCGSIHHVKTYHLELDDQGSVIVSTTVYEKLKEVNLAGLVYSNDVAHPPRITLNLGTTPLATFRIEEKKIGG